MAELDELQAECERIETTLRAVPFEAWTRPALGEWNLHELATHLTRGIGRLAVYIAAPAAEVPDKDRVSYFQYDPEKVAPGVAARAAQEAQEIPIGGVPDTFATVWRESVAAAKAQPLDRVVQTPLGALQISEYVATRILEAVVHHMDVRRALDQPSDNDPEAADTTAAILEALLDGPRPRNLGRERFILVATGRIPHEDARFPVMR